MPRAHTYVRPLDATSRDDIALAEFAMNESGNEFASGAFRLVGTQIMIAERDGMPVLVQPFYTALVMGSLAFVGQQSDEQKAAAQHAMTAAAYTEAHRRGLLDIQARSINPATRAFAQRHGFTPAHHPVLIHEVRV